MGASAAADRALLHGSHCGLGLESLAWARGALEEPRLWCRLAARSSRCGPSTASDIAHEKPAARITISRVPNSLWTTRPPSKLNLSDHSSFAPLENSYAARSYFTDIYRVR